MGPLLILVAGESLKIPLGLKNYKNNIKNSLGQVCAQLLSGALIKDNITTKTVDLR